MQIIEELLMQVMDSFILGFYFGKNLQNKHFSSLCALVVLDFAKFATVLLYLCL